MAMLLVAVGALVGLLTAGTSLAQSSKPLRIIAAEPNSGFDPNTATTDASRRMMELFYDTLLDYDKGGKLVPDLAKSWTAGSGGKVYTFKLQPTAKFSDGSAITAADVVYSIKRASKGAALKASLAIVSSIKAVDSKTVRISLKSKSRVFLNALARAGNAAILSEKAVTAAGPKKYFVKPTATSGAWVLSSYTTKSKASLAANPSYWKKGFPKIKSITYTFSTDATSVASALDSGAADMSFPMAPADAKRLAASGKVKMFLSKSPGVLFWGFNKAKAPFDDVRVRQALAYVVPRADRKTACWEGTGGVSYGATILPGSWAYSASVDTKYKVSKAKALAEAKKLLDAAGWKGSGTRKAQGVKGVADGTELKVTVPFENNWEQARCNTQLLKSALAPLGVNIVPQAYDPAQFWTDVGKDKFSMYHGGAGWATDDEMMEQGYTSDGLLTNLVGKWKNAKFDSLVKQAEATLDLDKAKQTYAKAQKIIVDEVPVIDTGAQYGVTVVVPGVKGYYPRSDNSSRALIGASF